MAVKLPDIELRLKRLILHKRMTDRDFADHVGIHRSHLSQVLNGKRNLTYSKIKDITDKFPDVSIKWLMHDEGPMIIEPRRPKDDEFETINDKTMNNGNTHQNLSGMDTANVIVANAVQAVEMKYLQKENEELKRQVKEQREQLEAAEGVLNGLKDEKNSLSGIASDPDKLKGYAEILSMIGPMLGLKGAAPAAAMAGESTGDADKDTFVATMAQIATATDNVTLAKLLKLNMHLAENPHELDKIFSQQ